MTPTAPSFSRSLLRLVVASSCSALLLLLAFSLYLRISGPSVPAGMAISPLDLSQHQAVAGQAGIESGQLRISEFDPMPPRHYALLVWQHSVQAAQLPFLQYEVYTERPGVVLSLAWRRADNPQLIHKATLNTPANPGATTYLGAHPEWRGTIIQLGLHVSVDDPATELGLSHLALAPYSIGHALAALHDDWLHLSLWNHFSINNLVQGNSAVQPFLTSAAALWAGLSVLLILAWSRFSPAPETTTTGALLFATALLPWLAVDGLWQYRLWHQLSVTEYHFGGRNIHEKHLADMDESIYRYALRLKSGVLPEQPARILLLHNSDGHNLARLKLQYYLLPHNVYNYDGLPPPGREKSVDYVILLGSTPPANIDASGGKLVQNDRALGVSLINSDPAGYLFRAVHDEAGAP